jgi:hypothetical protein
MQPICTDFAKVSQTHKLCLREAGKEQSFGVEFFPNQLAIDMTRDFTQSYLSLILLSSY